MTDWSEIGEDGLPVHLRFPLTESGEGPAVPEEFHHWGCWCSDPDCPGPTETEASE